MKRYAVAYALWLAGVLSFAAVAYAYYRRVVLPLQIDELVEPRAREPQPPDEG